MRFKLGMNLDLNEKQVSGAIFLIRAERLAVAKAMAEAVVLANHDGNDCYDEYCFVCRHKLASEEVSRLAEEFIANL